MIYESRVSCLFLLNILHRCQSSVREPSKFRRNHIRLLLSTDLSSVQQKRGPEKNGGRERPEQTKNKVNLSMTFISNTSVELSRAIYITETNLSSCYD